MIHHSVHINTLKGDVVQHGPHGQRGALQDVVLPNFQQLTPVAQTSNTSLHKKNALEQPSATHCTNCHAVFQGRYSLE